MQQLQNFELPVPAVNLLAGLFVSGAFTASAGFALDADVCSLLAKSGFTEIKTWICMFLPFVTKIVQMNKWYDEAKPQNTLL